MDGTVLLTQIVDLLLKNREDILMDKQFKHCGPCGGSRMDMVYKNPSCYQIGRLLDEFQQNRQAS